MRHYTFVRVNYMNKKLLILLVFTSLVIISVIFFLSILINTRQETTKTTPPPSTPGVPSSTPLPNELTLTSELPADDINSSYLPFQKVTLQFNDFVDPESVFIETNPNTQIDVFQGENGREIYIVPKAFWAIGRNYITILQTTTSVSGKRLLRPITYTINTAIPTLSPEELEADHP